VIGAVQSKNLPVEPEPSRHCNLLFTVEGSGIQGNRGQDFGLNIEFLTLLGFTFHVPLFHPWGTLVQAHRQGKYIACCIKHS
jgi:hypothetical protein